MIRLETERLILRNFCENDTQGLYELLANPRVNCYESEKVESMEEAYKEVLKKSKIDDGTELAVILSDTKEFIGTVFSVKEEPDTYSVCWNFLERFGKKGYAFEASSAYIDYLFYEKNARRIYAYVEDYNFNSQKLCEKLGMRKEGLFKEFISFVNNSDGTPKYENTYQYAVLRHERTSQKN